MRRYLALPVVVILAIQSIPAGATTARLDGSLQVEWYPGSLGLEPNEQRAVHMVVTNTAAEVLSVWLIHLKLTGADDPGVTISPDFFSLEPGRAQDVQVKIRSHAILGTDPEVTGAHLWVLWGRNLTRGQGDSVDSSTSDGNARIVIPVRNDLCIVLGVVAIVVVGALIVAIPLRRKGRSREPAGPMGPPPWGP